MEAICNVMAKAGLIWLCLRGANAMTYVSAVPLRHTKPGNADANLSRKWPRASNVKSRWDKNCRLLSQKCAFQPHEPKNNL